MAGDVSKNAKLGDESKNARRGDESKKSNVTNVKSNVSADSDRDAPKNNFFSEKTIDQIVPTIIARKTTSSLQSRKNIKPTRFGIQIIENKQEKSLLKYSQYLEEWDNYEK
jgi:hypothetical protein